MAASAGALRTATVTTSAPDDKSTFPREQDTRPRGILHSFHAYPAFRTLIIGTIASNSAFWMYQVAVGWLALVLTDSPFFVGMAGFAGGIPLLLLSLPIGVIIDRVDRRSVLLAAQFGVMAVSTLFAFLVGTDLIRPWSMLVLVTLYGAIMSFIFPTRTAIVPALVSREDMANAVALNSASQNATRVIGPSIAGVFIGVLGVAPTFALAAVLQVFAMFATMRLPRMVAQSTTKQPTGLAGLTVGFRVVLARPLLIALIVLALAPTVLVMPYINLMPVFARDVLGLGSSGLGVLLAATGLGTVAGSLAVARPMSRRPRPAAQPLMAAGFAALVMMFSATSNLPLAVVLLFAAGWLSSAFLARNQTEVQLNVEDEVRGRVLSIHILTWGMLPFGQLLVGWFANLLGTPAAMVLSSALALVAIGLIAWRFPMLRGQDEPAPGPARAVS